MRPNEPIDMRKSNIELLRIVLFTMVVCIHVGGPYLSSHTVSGVPNWQFANLLDGGSRVAVDCFVLLTGYFLVDAKDLKPSRQILRIVSPVAFYMLFYIPLFYLDASGDLTRALSSAATDLIANDIYLYHLWYTQVLVILYLFVPYMNALVSAVSGEKLRNLILVLYLVVSIIPSLVYLTGTQSFDPALITSRLGLFVLLYFTGAYVRRYWDTESKSRALVGSFLAADAAVVTLSFLYNSRLSPLIYFARLRGANLTYPMGGFSGAFYEFNNFLVIAAAVLLLLGFLQVRTPPSPVVNRIGGLTYGAYMVHVFWITVLSRFINPFRAAETAAYPLVASALVISVVVCSLGTEFVRQTAAGLLSKWLGFGAGTK